MGKKAVTLKALNQRGVEELLRHPTMKKILDQEGKGIRDAAGGEKAGYESHVWEGFDRSRGQVTAATRRAQADEARNRSLTRAAHAKG